MKKIIVFLSLFSALLLMGATWQIYQGALTPRKAAGQYVIDPRYGSSISAPTLQSMIPAPGTTGVYPYCFGDYDDPPVASEISVTFNTPVILSTDTAWFVRAEYANEPHVTGRWYTENDGTVWKFWPYQMVPFDLATSYTLYLSNVQKVGGSNGLTTSTGSFQIGPAFDNFGVEMYRKRSVSLSTMGERYTAGVAVAHPDTEDRKAYMYVFGGIIEAGDCQSDMWKWSWFSPSSDWQPVGDSPLGARGAFKCLFYDNKYWVMGGMKDPNAGGSADTDIFSDVKRTSSSTFLEGTLWTTATTTAAFGQRGAYGACVYADKMWVVGGWKWDADTEQSIRTNDVWYSTNGEHWFCATTSAAFSPRWGADLAVWRGKMWLSAGYDANDESTQDIWTSTDGITWTEEPTPANEIKAGSVLGVYADRLVLTGGRDKTTGQSTRDCYAYDGSTWTEYTDCGPNYNDDNDMGIELMSGVWQNCFFNFWGGLNNGGAGGTQKAHWDMIPPFVP